MEKLNTQKLAQKKLSNNDKLPKFHDNCTKLQDFYL